MFWCPLILVVVCLLLIWFDFDLLVGFFSDLETLCRVVSWRLFHHRHPFTPIWMNCGSRWTILSNGSNGERSKILITLFWWCTLSHEGCITFNWKMISSPRQGILRRWRNLPWKRKPWTLIGFYWTFANWDLLVEPSFKIEISVNAFVTYNNIILHNICR